MTKLLDADIYKPVKEWQGLSDIEIGEAQPPIDVQMSMDEFMDTFARAIEAKLRIKNGY